MGVDRPRLGITGDGTLSPCPASPNCVCSDVGDAVHGIEPLEITGDATAAWRTLQAHLESQPRVTIVECTDDYLHAEVRTRWLRFVDDMEFHLRPADKQIAMRSASRVGHSDLGTNRRRLESLRSALEARL